VISFLIFGFAMLASALFASAETGHYGVSDLRLNHMSKGSRLARLQKRIGASSAGYLCALLVCNNLANDAVVHAAAAMMEQGGFEDPHVVVAFLLTPIVFLFGDFLPKQWMLGDPSRRVLLLTPFILPFRVLLWPVTAPLAAMLKFFGLEDGGGYGRGQLAALLLEGSRDGEPAGMAMQAARAALKARGTGLHPFLRVVPLLPATTSLAAARRQLASAKGALALHRQAQGPPRLLLGSRLARAGQQADLASLGIEIPQLAPEMELSDALARLRELNVSFALVVEASGSTALFDLEHILGALLAAAAPVE